MASKMATKRLQKEYQMMMANPPEFIVARPLEENILVWHYIVTGPPDSPYAGGEYHGKVVFPDDYPYKPPSIRMLTPNGRFQMDTRLCLSMSDFHPATWNPAWSVATILTGLLSFMLEDTPTTGAVSASSQERRALATKSHAWNRADARFQAVFPDLLDSPHPTTPTTATPNPFSNTSAAATTAVVATAASKDARKRIVQKHQPEIKIQHHQQQQQQKQQVVLLQRSVNGAWSRLRSNIWLLLLGGVMAYLLVLKVMAKLV